MTNPAKHDDPLLTTKEAARYLRMSPATLASWRVKMSDGPRFVRIGGRVFYPLSELKKFRRQRLYKSTSEYTFLRKPTGPRPLKKDLVPGKLKPLNKAS